MRIFPSFLKSGNEPLPTVTEALRPAAAAVAAPKPSVQPTASSEGGDPLAVIGKRNEDIRQGVESLLARLHDIAVFRTQVEVLVAGVANVIDELEATRSKLGESQGALIAERDSHAEARRRIGDLASALERIDADHRMLFAERDRLDGVVQSLEFALDENGLAMREKEIILTDLQRELSNECELHRQTAAENEGRRTEVERLSLLVAALENDLADQRDRWGLTEDENRTLRIALEEAQNASLRLNRRVSELEPVIQRLREQNAQLESSFHAERESSDRTRAQAADEQERLKGEIGAKQVKLEAVSSRADANERFLAEARRQLRDKLEELRVSERKSIDASLQVNTLQKRLEAAEREGVQAAVKTEEVEKSRRLILERSEVLTKAMKNKDAALQKTEQKLQFLTERLEDTALRTAKSREQYEQRIAELTEQLEKEKTERALAEGALQSARRERLSLQRELLNVKAGVRDDRGPDADSAPAEEDIKSMADFDDNVKPFTPTP